MINNNDDDKNYGSRRVLRRKQSSTSLRIYLDFINDPVRFSKRASFENINTT